MHIDFLEAKVLLTKTFSAHSKHPYPNAFEFKSHSYLVRDLEKLTDLLKQHAKQGHCVLKGRLNAPLEWEPRAGRTSSNQETDWLCLDLDGLKSVADPEAFMAKIGLADISYILQWSASYGVYSDFTLRAHIFVQLTRPAAPSAVKTWLKHLNLTHFQNELELTKTHMALRWPVDITTCQNDKILYIAPPTCTPESLNKFTGERITYIQKSQDTFDFHTQSLVPAEQLRAMEEDEINRQRTTRGLTERKATQFKLKQFKGEYYLPNPDQATVTGVREQRGFIYLNLNGGDSWGYWHPADNPTFVYNFKGEPVYKTAELLPDYYYNLVQTPQSTNQAQSNQRMYLAFRDFKSAEYYNGWFEPTTNELTLKPAKSEKQLADFLTNHGQPVPEAVPIWDLVYDPQGPLVDIPNRRVNLFRPSRYMQQAQKDVDMSNVPLLECPPTIRRVFEHVVGPDMLEHLFNWLAFCWQYRRAPCTAWIWHGIQGTGKGLLIHELIRPLFGESNVVLKRMEELEDKFNDFLEGSLIAFVDEAQISNSARNNMIMANLKNYITEPVVSIRRMRQNAYETPNHCAWIFASNVVDPVVIEATDRRFNVGMLQSNKLEITTADVATIQAERQDFANFLQAYKVDVDRARTAADNEWKAHIISMSRSSADEVADSILKGDLARLWDSLPTVEPAMLDTATAVKLHPYKSLLYDIVMNERNKLSREELYILFSYTVGNVPSSPHKLTSYLKHHGIVVKNIRTGSAVQKGTGVSWQQPKEWFDERRAEIIAEQGGPKLTLVKSEA